MIKGLLKGHTHRVKESQQATLALKEQAKTIEALEAQALETQKKLATAEKRSAWALNLWNEVHPPSAHPPSAHPPSPGSPPQ